MPQRSGGLGRATLACGAVLLVVSAATAATVESSGGPEPVATSAPAPVTEAPCPAPGARGDGAAPLVTFIGDSTTALAALPTDLAPEGAITGAFAEDYRIHVEAQPGRTIGEMLDEVAAVLDDPGGAPDALVVNLGTNDAIQGTTDWRAAFDELLALVEDHPCVLLVTVNEATGAFIRPGSTTAASINARIAEAATAPNVFHVDWNEDWRPDADSAAGVGNLFLEYTPPEALPPELRAAHPTGMWVGDGVHQSPEGSVELASRIRRVLDQVSAGRSADPVEP